MPPKPGRPAQRPPKGQIARRRAIAALLLVAFLGLALWLGVSAFGDNPEKPPPVVTGPALGRPAGRVPGPAALLGAPPG